MNAFLLLYFGLLIVWPLLLWPAWRLRAWSGLWLFLVAVAGCAAAVREIWLFLGTSSAIRLDILLISVVLVVLYMAAVVVLAWRRWRKLAILLGALLILLGAGMIHQWILAGQEAERLREVFHARNALLFDAGFRSPAAYEAAYGPFANSGVDHPVGHWLALEDTRFSRLIINAKGEAWAFYRCGDTECPYGPDGGGLLPQGEAASWGTTLLPSVGAALPLTLRLEAPERLALQVEGQAEQFFAPAPPPIVDPPAPEALAYLGPFTAFTCKDDLVDFQQLWLWREQDRLFAVGVFSRLLAGLRHGFITPLVLGDAPQDGDAWFFDWQQNGKTVEASIAFAGEGLDLSLQRQGQAAVTIQLEPGGLLVDPAIENASLTDGDAWRHWFDIVLVGQFTKGVMPAC
jgi:hypothetical protein